MTIAKLASKPPKSTGLTHGLLDRLYEQRSAGKPVPLLDLFGKASVVGHGEKGDTRWVELEWVRLEVAADGETAEQISHLVTVSFERRTSAGTQMNFFDDGTEQELSEQRTMLRGFLAEWQTEQDPVVSDADLAERWNDFHDGSYGPLDEAKPTLLREFCKYLGALPDEAIGGEADDDTAAPEPDDDATAEPSAAASTENVVPFQQPAAEQ